MDANYQRPSSLDPQKVATATANLRAMFFPGKEPHVPKPKAAVGTPVQVSVNHRRRFIRQLAIEQRTTTKRAGKRFDRLPPVTRRRLIQQSGVMG